MGKIAGNQSSPVYVYKATVTGAASGVLNAIPNTDNGIAGADLIITRAYLITTAAASGACTLDLGVGDSASDVADSRANDLLDGIDVNAGAGTFDSIALDIAGATGVSTPLAWPKDDYVLLHVASGNGTGLAGTLYIEYTYA